MKLSDALQVVIFPGLALLPRHMTSLEAIAMLLAIGLQESRFTHRRQIGGPARGFYQFEHGGGVKGVLQHRSTMGIICNILDRLEYDRNTSTSYNAIEHNDTLATVYARLLLWTLPAALPGKDDDEWAWEQYIEAWRPGRPHRDTWSGFYRQAWAICSTINQ
jgi:hypothetical protein